MNWSLVMQALKSARVKAGQRVLIHGGSGGVGSVAIQIAKALGAHVTSTCSTKNMQLVKVPDMRSAGCAAQCNASKHFTQPAALVLAAMASGHPVTRKGLSIFHCSYGL